MVDTPTATLGVDDEKFFALKVEQDTFRRAFRMYQRFQGPNGSLDSVSHTGTQIKSLISALKSPDFHEQPDLVSCPCIFAVNVNPTNAEMQVMPVPILPQSEQDFGAEIFKCLEEMNSQFEFFRNKVGDKMNKDCYPNIYLLIRVFLWYAKKQIQKNSEFLRDDANTVISVLESLELAPGLCMRELAAKIWLDSHPNLLLLQKQGASIPTDPKGFLGWLESEEAEHVLPLNHKKIRAEIQNEAQIVAQNKKTELVETLVTAAANTGQYRAIHSTREVVGTGIARIDLMSANGGPSERQADKQASATVVKGKDVYGLPPNSAPISPFRARKATTDPQGSTFFDTAPDTKKLFTIPPPDDTSKRQ